MLHGEVIGKIYVILTYVFLIFYLFLKFENYLINLNIL